MKYLQIDGKYMDCPDPEAHLKQLIRDNKIEYARFIMMQQFISYGLRKVVDGEGKTIFQLSDEPIRPKPREKKHHAPEHSLS